MSNSVINERLEDIRSQMREKGINVYIVPNFDPHLSEYPPERWNTRKWASGFTGSAGSAAISLNEAALWSDSRYFIQAENELQGTGFSFYKDGLPETISLNDWACQQAGVGGTIAADDTTFSYNEGVKMKAMFAQKGVNLTFDFNPIDELWKDRPSIPDNKIFIHDIKYAGEDFSSKYSRIITAAQEKGANGVLLSALDDIAWAFNIRGCDVKFNPVVVAYAYLSCDARIIFIEKCKLTEDVEKYFNDNNIEVKDYSEIQNYLENLKEETKVIADPARVNFRLCNILNTKGALIAETSPIALMKSIKNSIEIEGTKNALIRDGVAMVNFLCWIDNNIGKTEMSEISIAEKLRSFRAEQPMFIGESFGTIAGYGGHGAIVHYRATEESNAKLQPKGFVLVDSGGQYLDGTTDITRTIPLGELSDEEKKCFTLVLKGHIAIAQSQFPKGTRGAQIDAFARIALWREGYTYMHGTGHGIGHFLNVHEGPQNIRLEENPTPLTPGMMTSNEPGVYLSERFGIRTENIILTTEKGETEFGKFYEFETLTLCPIDTRAINTALMTDGEIEWLNQYHNKVYTTLSPMLNCTENMWLKERCNTIKKEN
ncbi:MAG: aminopeptidase P family protein [Bacteroidales bacterium]|nr:aminopeptidase P family protein [Bacteroidales bacterium]